jgi:hypothetical protein
MYTGAKDEHTNFTGPVNMTRLNTQLTAQWVNDPGAVWAYETRLGLTLECVHDLEQRFLSFHRRQ